MMRRHLSGVGAGGVLLAVLLSSAPAWGHATFATKVVPADSDQRIVVDVPHERNPDDFNVAVDVAIPSGWNATGCEATAPWQCRVDGTNPQVVRWNKDPAAGANANDEKFVFTAHTGPPGNYPFPTNQTYNTGEKLNWVGPAGSDEPAPILKAEGAAGSATTAPASTQPGTTAGKSSGDSSSTAPIVAAVAAAIIGVGAIAWAVTRRRHRAGQPPTGSGS